MSTHMFVEQTCSVCGKTHRYTVISSTNAFGSPDLDLRPPEMQRSTMDLWVQECPDCGYVCRKVSDRTTVTREYLQTPEYRSCDGIDFDSVLAARFYKCHMIDLRDQNTIGAFNSLLHAAWACDDNREKENAEKCRLLSLPLVTGLISDDRENKDTLRLVRADVMRRAGLFAGLKEEYAPVRFGEELLNQILAFELYLAGKEDTACYRVEDAVKWSQGGGWKMPD